MKYKTPLHMKKLLREKGKLVGIYYRTETTDENGITEYTYSDSPTIVYGVIYSTKGFRETWYEVGSEYEVDYLITLEATVTINNGDRIDIGDGIIVYVEEKVPRGSGFSTQYWELLCNRIEGPA